MVRHQSRDPCALRLLLLAASRDVRLLGGGRDSGPEECQPGCFYPPSCVGRGNKKKLQVWLMHLGELENRDGECWSAIEHADSVGSGGHV